MLACQQVGRCQCITRSSSTSPTRLHADDGVGWPCWCIRPAPLLLAPTRLPPPGACMPHWHHHRHAAVMPRCSAGVPRRRQHRRRRHAPRLHAALQRLLLLLRGQHWRMTALQRLGSCLRSHRLTLRRRRRLASGPACCHGRVAPRPPGTKLLAAAAGECGGASSSTLLRRHRSKLRGRTDNSLPATLRQLGQSSPGALRKPKRSLCGRAARPSAPGVPPQLLRAACARCVRLARHMRH